VAAAPQPAPAGACAPGGRRMSAAAPRPGPRASAVPARRARPRPAPDCAPAGRTRRRAPVLARACRPAARR
jgi:hypothetical protein